MKADTVICRRSFARDIRWIVLTGLAGMLGIFQLPACAAPTYIYLYTGNPFSEGPFFDANDPRADGEITVKITTPTPLTVGDGQQNTPGLNYRMSDGVFNLQYPESIPPYDMTYPISFYGNLSILALGGNGLPASWNITLGKSEGTHGAFNQSLTTSFFTDPNELSWDNSYHSGYGPIYTVNNPGEWRMYIETNPAAVPEPSAALLLGTGWLGLTVVRQSRKRRLARA